MNSRFAGPPSWRCQTALLNSRGLIVPLAPSLVLKLLVLKVLQVFVVHNFVDWDSKLNRSIFSVGDIFN